MTSIPHECFKIFSGNVAWLGLHHLAMLKKNVNQHSNILEDQSSIYQQKMMHLVSSEIDQQFDWSLNHSCYKHFSSTPHNPHLLDKKSPYFKLGQKQTASTMTKATQQKKNYIYHNSAIYLSFTRIRAETVENSTRRNRDLSNGQFPTAISKTETMCFILTHLKTEVCVCK